MKSTGLVIPAKGRFELQAFELPDPEPGQLLLEAACSALSPGAERNIVLGTSLPLTLPVAIGRHATYLLADERFVTPVREGTDLEQAAFFNLAHTGLFGVRQAKVELGPTRCGTAAAVNVE